MEGHSILTNSLTRKRWNNWKLEGRRRRGRSKINRETFLTGKDRIGRNPLAKELRRMDIIANHLLATQVVTSNPTEEWFELVLQYQILFKPTEGFGVWGLGFGVWGL